jgi:hypothetical protein
MGGERTQEHYEIVMWLEQKTFDTEREWEETVSHGELITIPHRAGQFPLALFTITGLLTGG